MNALTDPKQILADSPMTKFQIVAVGICILLNALDGFDVLAISFASPGIASEWAINRAELGVVLAMELFGMAVGSVALGGIADRFGRRPTILVCLLIMSVGMYASSLANDTYQLLMARFFTGLGIGGMLASINAMTAEYANTKFRSFAVVMTAAGYPMGAIIGGTISTQLLEVYDWRAIFVFGAICTGCCLVVVWTMLPESIEYLATKRPKHYLERINKTLVHMGHGALSQLPPLIEKEKTGGFTQLFASRYRVFTLLLTIAYFMHIMTFYYILKWIPKIVVDMGYQASSAGAVLVWANVGGMIGALLLGLFSTRFRLRTLLIFVLLLSFVLVTAFGLGYQQLSTLSMVAAFTGFCTNAGVVGLYALMASVFPPDLRASGTGIVIGIGRGGAALGPVIAGFLFAAEFGLMGVSVVMGAGAVVAAMALFFMGPALKRHVIATNI